jgi:uncharacterized protein (TIGR03067 family)
MPRWLMDSLATGGPAHVVVDAVAKATILLCLTTAVAAVLRRSAAAVRHRLWGLTLCGLIVFPFLSWSLPGWRLPILPSTMGLPGSQASWNEGAAELGFNQALNDGSPDGIHSTQPIIDHGWPGPTQASRRRHPNGSSGTSPGSSPMIRSFVAPGAVLRESARIMLLWVLGFITVGLPALAGVVGNEWRRRQSRLVVDQNWLQLLDGLAQQFALRRRIELRTSPVPLIPMTWGVLQPVVLLPEQAQQWPEPVRRLVLLHELAHIKRWDVSFQLMGRLATAVYWFHPLAWYALCRLRADCECACDDYVVHVGARRTDYAQQLVDLARSLRAAILTTAVPMTRKNTLEQRIKALFDERRNHQPLSHRVARVLLACGLVVLTSLAVVHLGPSAAGHQPRTNTSPATTATEDTAQAGRKPAAAATGTPARENPPAATPNGFIHERYTHPITVTGRAVDLADRPVTRAVVYLASRRGDYKRVAETTTDAEGRYKFDAVPLPIERANTVKGRDEGEFQVFGQAKGFGFGWQPTKLFHPQRSAATDTHVPRRDPPEAYEAKDKIELDLRFPPSARFSGTVVDDRGNPLPNVSIEIRDCESLGVIDNLVRSSLDALNERDSAPPSMKLRTTDAGGRFEFTDMPVDCRFLIDLRAKNFPWRRVYAATTRDPQPDYQGTQVLTGDFQVTLATPVDVPVKMVFGDTREPAPRVAVQAVEGYVNILETTDDEGRVTLRLPPGTYRMENWPARGTPYLVTGGELVVGTSPPVEPIVHTLRPAGIVEVTVVDAETGAGIPDVDVWEQADPNGRRERLVFRSWEVATRIAWRESPRTDAHGKLRALVESGKHRIGVGLESYPRNLEVVETSGQDVECRSGEAVQLKYTMRKRPFGIEDDDASRKAIEALQGTWVLESYTTDGVAKSGEDESTTFHGERDTIVGNRRVYRYKFTMKGIADDDDRIPRDEITIDATKSPQWFDSRSVNRPEGWVRLGIYKLEGDRLTICWRIGRRGMEDKIERPKAFEAEAGSQSGLSIYNRLKP